MYQPENNEQECPYWLEDLPINKILQLIVSFISLNNFELG